MKVAIVIPARFASSRFPGKPLALIKGKPMIRWVYEACAKTGFPVYVATEDDAIRQECEQWYPTGIGDILAQPLRVIMTRTTHLTGTDRCYEANEKIDADIVVNVQGDEPLVSPESILEVIEAAMDHEGCVINAVTGCGNQEELQSLNTIKMVATREGKLLYASRAPIPRLKSGEPCGRAWKQVCVYAIPKAKLAKFAWCGRNGKTFLETQEDIEILRFLELGMPVHVVPVESGSLAVDVPEDIAKVEAEMDRRSFIQRADEVM